MPHTARALSLLLVCPHHTGPLLQELGRGQSQEGQPLIPQLLLGMEGQNPGNRPQESPLSHMPVLK